MKKVFIVHGFGGTPNGGWLSWLMKEFASRGIYACSLPMPNPKTPVVSEWVSMIDKCIGEPNEETFILGHSLGVPGVLHYLNSLGDGKKIGGAVLVSGLIEPLQPNDPESIYRKIDSFVVPKIDLNQSRNKAKKFIVIHSTDDPAVPFEHSGKIIKGLDCDLIKVEKGGHFFILSKPIVNELPIARDAILKLLEE